MPAAAATSEGSDALTAEAVARAHAHLLHDPSLQFGFEQLRPPEIPGWLRVLARLIEAVAPVLGWAFWIALALGGAAILVFVLREVLARRAPKSRARPVPPRPEWRPEPARARALLEEADALASQGLYAEAAHVLLHRSIADIDDRRPRAVRPALTARDIAALEALPESARPAFRQIAAVVERSFFGGRGVGEADFAACRQAYEAFALPGGWR
jgi:hypothetical protein